MRMGIILSIFLWGCSLGISKKGVEKFELNNSITIKSLDRKNFDKPALRVEKDAGNTNRPEIALDSLGNVMAVFEKSDGQKNRIYVVQSDQHSPWKEPKTIDNGKGDAFRPILATLNEEIFVVYPQKEENFLRLYAVRFSPKNNWEDPVIIDPGTGIADGARVVLDNSGNAFVAFEYFDGRGSKIFFNKYSAGKGWGKPENIDQRTGNAYYPQIILIENNPLVAFVQEQSNDWALYVRRFKPEMQGWMDAERVDTSLKVEKDPPAVYTESLYAHQFKKKFWWEGPSKNDAKHRNSNTPQIAVDPQGKIFVVHRKWNGEKFRIAANYFESNKKWAKAKYIDSGRIDAEHPSIAVNSQGKVVVIFAQKEGSIKEGFSRVVSSEFNQNAGWSEPKIIDQGEGDAYGPRLALTANDKIVAVWCQWKNNLVRSWITPYDSDKGWGFPQITNPDNYSTCGTRLAANKQGQVVTVFEQENGEGGDNQIYIGRYSFENN